MDTFSDEDRKKYLGKLCANLTPISKQHIRWFQLDWDKSKSYSEFKKEQNEIIRMCLKIELSISGKDVRTLAGMDVLTLNSDL